MGKPSRDKGKRVERQACHALRAAGFASARRTAQVDGGLRADILTEKDIHFEVKGRKGIGAMRFLEQAEEDAQGEAVPVALLREDGDTDFAILLRLDDLPRLLAQWPTPTA